MYGVLRIQSSRKSFHNGARKIVIPAGENRHSHSIPFLTRTALFLAGVVILTSSFDIFLVIHAGGTYRICQVAGALLLSLALLKTWRAGIKPILGLTPLIIWFAFQALFIPIAPFWQKSFAYCVWLMLNIATMFAFVQLFSNDLRVLTSLLRWYTISFPLVASFGIAQFILPLVGYPGLFVEQWWIPDHLARANGFSYEPSYFATYLLIGLVFVASLRHSHSPLFKQRTMSIIYWITAVGILVSSSRMGIIMLLLDFLLVRLTPWLKVFRELFEGRIVSKSLKALIPSFVYLTVLSVITLAFSHIVVDDPSIGVMLLNGTGIGNTAAHSVLQREDAFSDTLTVFLEHPLVGQSLGGVSSAIAGLHGEIVSSFEASKLFEGMNVFAEALAASGAVGIIPFAIFLTKTIRNPLRLASVVDPLYGNLLRALVRALLFCWIILQFNQNMLRPYLWVHIAVLCAVYSAARNSGMRTQFATAP